MTTPFVGADFSIEGIAQLGLTGIRVTYTHDPIAANPNGANDALNVGFYSLSGPGDNFVVHAAIVPDDPQSIDLALSAPLLVGTWTLTVSSTVQTQDGRALQAPRQASMLVTQVIDTGDLTGGAKQDSAESIIRKHLPSSLVGRAWDALIAALAVGDRLNWDNALLAFDQLFKSTASGFYLDRKNGDDGLERPLNIGMPDDLFRRLGIKTSAAKLTHEVLLEILEVFYGADAVRASITTDLSEPFVLADGDTLELLTDERQALSIIFHEADFARISQAKAVEVAAAITRDLRKNRNQGFALPFADPITNTLKVRVYSGSLGLGSSVRVTGGRAQLGLSFPSKLETYGDAIVFADSYSWVVTSPKPGVNRLTLTSSGPSSKVDLSVVRTGDYVIFEAVDANIAKGIYQVLDVAVSFSGSNLVQSFSIAGDAANHSFQQVANQDLSFFRPTRSTIHVASNRNVILAQTVPGKLEVQIPATTQAVGRQNRTASYLHDTEALEVSSIHREGSAVTVTTSSAHGLSLGDFVSVEEAASSIASPAVTAGDHTTLSDASLATIWSETAAPTVLGAAGRAYVALQDQRVMLIGGYNGTDDADITGVCQAFSVTGSTTLTDGSKQYSYGWTSLASMSNARYRHRASVLPNGKVLVTGGTTNSFSAVSSCELYDPALNTWSAAASLGSFRMDHSQVTLADGRILAIAGYHLAITASAEIYDPTANTWSFTGALNYARSTAPAVLLNSGKVLVAGGANGGSLSTCEIYDPGTNTWTETGRMSYARVAHTLTLLSDGRVLAVGGQGYPATQPGSSVDLADAEIYDPSTGRWSPAGRTSAPVSGHSAVYLAAKKKVLVAGSINEVSEYFDETTFKWRKLPNALSGDWGQGHRGPAARGS
jgi:N-acetylneuraminic acid mutarotase